MARKRTRRLTGITSFRDPDTGTTMASHEEMTIDPDQVSCRIGPLGDKAAGRKIVSLDRAVIRYQHRIVNAREAHAYRLSTPRAVPKPEPSRRPMMTCPLCEGTQAEEDGRRCRQCGGTGRMPRP